MDFLKENVWIPINISLQFIAEYSSNGSDNGFVADQVTSHYLNQWGIDAYMCHSASMS